MFVTVGPGLTHLMLLLWLQLLSDSVWLLRKLDFTLFSYRHLICIFLNCFSGLSQSYRMVYAESQSTLQIFIYVICRLVHIYCMEKISFLLSLLSNYSLQNCVQPKLSIAFFLSSVICQLHPTQLTLLFNLHSCPHLPGLVIFYFLSQTGSFRSSWFLLQFSMEVPAGLTMALFSFSRLPTPASTTGSYILIMFLPSDSCLTTVCNSVK